MARRSFESRSLRSTGAVMQALGGVHGVCELTGSPYKATHNWTRAPKFPARYFLVMIAALKRRGLTAPPELWGMVVTPKLARRAS
jgi:hypothetical protein